MTKFAAEREMRSSPFCCPVVELRQYTLHPGKRDVLMDLFDREFVETQEEVGIKSSVNFETLIGRDNLYLICDGK